MITALRNHILHVLYTYLAKPLFFKQDPELVHERMIKLGKRLGYFWITRTLLKCLFSYSNKKLEQTILGIHFKNPIGLAAGFDKDAELIDIMPGVGFGFTEVGSITGEPCIGNPKPRLWRLPKSKSLVVHYGLKNHGCQVIANRLQKKQFKLPVGVSIAKTNSKSTVDTKKGIADYVKAYRTFLNKGIGDYYTINISCPNAFGGQPFTCPVRLGLLLREITKLPRTKPLFLKLSPDITKEKMDKLLAVIKKYNIDGVICTNLKKKNVQKHIEDDFTLKKGGVSGKLVAKESNELIKYIYKKTKGDLVIMGCGGVFTAQDAYEKIRAGASLVQMITGMIYEGPQCMSEINQGLVQLLKKDGFNNIHEAIGADHRGQL